VKPKRKMIVVPLPQKEVYQGRTEDRTRDLCLTRTAL
jgi:hypothetical protein